MSENTSEVILGGVVLAVALGFTVYAGQVTGFATSERGGYMLEASFRSAEGVSLGADVRLAGVKIGSVTGMELDPQSFRADLEFSLRESLRLPDDSAAVVASEGLMGGTYIEILPGGSPYNLESGDQIYDTQSAVSLLNLLIRAATGGEQSLDDEAPAQGTQ